MSHFEIFILVLAHLVLVYVVLSYICMRLGLLPPRKA